MAGGMKFDRDVAEPQLLAIADGLGAAGEIVAVAQPHHVERLLRGQHRAMAGAGVVGMAMGDHGPLDRPHRIDVEAAGLAAQSGGTLAAGCLADASASYSPGSASFESCANLSPNLAVPTLPA